MRVIFDNIELTVEIEAFLSSDPGIIDIRITDQEMCEYKSINLPVSEVERLIGRLTDLVRESNTLK